MIDNTDKGVSILTDFWEKLYEPQVNRLLYLGASELLMALISSVCGHISNVKVSISFTISPFSYRESQILNKY